jgi:hypothetical protein
MAAKRIAGMARSYKYPQTDRRNCPPSLLHDSAPWGGPRRSRVQLQFEPHGYSWADAKSLVASAGGLSG